MPERFVSLAALVRPPALPEPPPVPEPRGEPELEPEPAVVATVREALTFRLRLSEAFAAAREGLLADLAAAVLVRELRLAPADVEAIGAELLRAHAADVPVALRVCAADRERVRADVPVEVDGALRPGDAVLVVRDGALEATLGIRLAAVLAAAR